MLYSSGDRVIVKASRSGYTGPGEVVDKAYGLFYLVRIDKGGEPSVVLVRATDLVHDKARDKKGKDA